MSSLQASSDDVFGGGGTGVSRVVADLDELAAISEVGPGVTRVAYTPADAEARGWFERRCEALAMRFEVDAYGTCIGWSVGCQDRRAVLIGSHLDSVREAGRYDGVLGVVVGFEVARRVLEDDPNAPVAVVAFACEESTRFGMGAVGSRLLVGDLSPDALDEVRDLEGMTLRDALANAGLDSQPSWSFDPRRLSSFVEVHIDQGSGLAGTSAVGVVRGIAGVIRMRICWTGETSHSGAHARSRRRNALLAAARFIVDAESIWERSDPGGDAAAVTVGWIENRPNAANSVSGVAEVVVDIRGTSAGMLRQVRDELSESARHIGSASRIDVDIEILGHIDPVAMDTELMGRLCHAGTACGVEYRVMPSMAGHDAEVMAVRVPTAMLLVANPAGVSHSPQEAMDEMSLGGALRMLDVVITDLVRESTALDTGGGTH